MADVREPIAAVALSPPRILIGMNPWSLAKLRQYLIEQKIVADISVAWLRVLLREAGVRWRRTKIWRRIACGASSLDGRRGGSFSRS